jgi:uncharacterized repeat protein (TIGR03803 family)
MRQRTLLRNLPLWLAKAIFSLLCVSSVAAQSDQTLYSFTGGADGNSPLSNLILDKAGNLYGTTFVGGAYGDGEVFELTHNQAGEWTETVLYSFTGGVDGADPYYAGVIFDSSGNLYGTTTGGGTSNFGTVFELTPSGGGWSETVLHSFAGGKDGQSPYAGLTFDAAGNLYGTTYEGGVFGDGTVFELKPEAGGQWHETVIHAFDLTDGDAPAGGVVLDSAGNIYGVTEGGGASTGGVVYELVKSSNGSWKEKLLHGFGSGSDGSSPYAEQLVFDSKGNLYGTTMGGGAQQSGTIFELSPSTGGSWREAVLYSFNTAIEGNPYSGLIFDSKGNLYGTCANGNGESTVGAVFQLNQKTGKWSGRNLFLFTRTDGEFPEGGLAIDGAGNLYGTTALGGAFNQGAVFELIP